MKVVVNEKSPIERELEVSVDSVRVQQSYDKHMRDVIRSVAIPGFRKGKAPRALVERYANREQLQRTVFEEVGIPAYQQALKEEKLAPLGDPDVQLVQFEPGKDLIFKATIEIRPQFEIVDDEYQGIEVDVPRGSIGDQDVDEFLQNLRQKAMRTVTVDEERGLRQDDVAVVDLEAREGDALVPNGKGENYQIEINDDLFTTGFYKNLLDVKVEERKTFDFEFPADYGNKDLAGKNITFDVTLKTIKKHELPELDDDFASEVSRFSTMDALKADVRKKLERNYALEVGNRAIYKLAEKRSDIPVPRAVTNTVIMHTLESQARQLAQVGVKFDDFLRSRNLDVRTVVAQMRPSAELSARAEFVLEAIAAKEDVKVSDDELQAELREFAESQQRSYEDVKAEMEKEKQVERFRSDVLRQRILTQVAEKANVRVVAEDDTDTKEGGTDTKEVGADTQEVGASPTAGASEVGASDAEESTAKPAKKAARSKTPKAGGSADAGEAERA